MTKLLSMSAFGSCFMVHDALTLILREFKRDVSVIEVDAEDISRKSLLY